jgi:uncharacterized protein
MKESKLFLKKAGEFFLEARLLFEKGFWPGATNRAYYSMFTAARAVLMLKGITAKTHAGTHQKFSEVLVKEGILPIELAKMLNRAYQYRQEVDYELEVEIDEETATKIFIEAAVFLERVKAYLENEFSKIQP